MPFYNYVNMCNPDDIVEDAWFGKYEDRPAMLAIDGKMYEPKFDPVTSDPILKGAGWTSTSKVKYATEEQLAFCAGQKRVEADLLARKLRFAEKLKKGDID